MKLRVRLAVCLACTSCAAHGSDLLTASLRVNPEWRVANDASRLAPLQRQLAGGADRVTTDLEVGAAAGAFAGTATVRHVAIQDRGASTAVLLNELHLSAQQAGWYFTTGKKVVSWDVGQAFRPLDVIQQENRRRLVATRLEGVPVLLAERFGAHTSTSIVIANPAGPSRLGNEERSLAARFFWQDGPMDWHAVARVGEHTGWRAGVAVAYVATAALELHASLLGAQRLERLQQLPTLLPAYEMGVGEGGAQALLGASWTGASKISVLLEWWHDARAWSAHRWERWGSDVRAASQDVATLPALGGQARALNVPSLHRDNALLRLAYAAGSFAPSADVLYMPADGGTIATVRLQWQGTRSSVEAGWRCNLGPASSVVRQLPSSSTLFVSADINF